MEFPQHCKSFLVEPLGHLRDIVGSRILVEPELGCPLSLLSLSCHSGDATKYAPRSVLQICRAAGGDVFLGRMLGYPPNGLLLISRKALEEIVVADSFAIDAVDLEVPLLVWVVCRGCRGVRSARGKCWRNGTS